MIFVNNKQQHDKACIEGMKKQNMKIERKLLNNLLTFSRRIKKLFIINTCIQTIYIILSRLNAEPCSATKTNMYHKCFIILISLPFNLIN
jgi:hypothetical protein